jgi:hypothetical protein
MISSTHPPPAIAELVDLQRSIEQGPDALARIERAERVLEDHLHAPAMGRQRPAFQPGDVGAVERHRALGRRHQPQDCLAER